MRCEQVMTKIIAFFAPWLVPVAITAFIALLGCTWLMSSKLTRAGKTIDALRVELATEKSTAQTNFETAKLCSASVTRLHEEATENAARNAVALAAARKAAAAKQSAGLRTLQTPMAVPADQCASIVDLTTTWKASRGVK